MPRQHSNTPPSNLTVVAKFGRTYGVRGWLHLNSFTDPIDNVADYSSWYIDQGQGWQEVSIEDMKPHKHMFVVKISGIDSPELARSYSGKEIAVTTAELRNQTEADEILWQDLYGCEVINEQFQVLGKIAYLLETPAHDVIAIKSPSKDEILIPYTHQHVLDVNLKDNQVRVDWPLDWTQ